ncbi:MAG: hypothetical protein V4598_01140 [Bdellovibrionota bacterium]
MRFFLILLTITLSLGSILALHFSRESMFFPLLYILGAYQLYRVNYGKSFFLTFHNQKEAEVPEPVKLRLGPGEFAIKDEVEKKEDQFVDMFDWKKTIPRHLLSWGLFIAAIYIFFMKLQLEVSLANVLPLISFLFISRSVSIGHLLVPLALNLVTILFSMDEFSGRENIAFAVYGILFIVNLALIYPSEDRMGMKIRQWMSGRWMELLRTVGILLITFTAAKFLLSDLKFDSKEPEIPKSEILRQINKVNRMQSSLKRMTEQGLFENRALKNRARELTEKMKEVSSQEKFSPDAWKECKDEGEKLNQDIQSALSESKAPDLTPKLLNQMKKDLSSRPLDDKALDLLERMNNFKGGEGSDLVSDYRDMKFGNGGFYQEQMEFDDSTPYDQNPQLLQDLKNAEEKKKDITERLNKNIEDLKANPDEGLLSVNKALKDELDQIDSMSGQDKAVMQNELRRSEEIQKNLMEKAQSPESRKKIQELANEASHLNNEMTPHMNALAKSELAKKILDHQKKMENTGREVKEETSEKIKKDVHEEEKKEDTKDSGIFKKFLKFAAIATGAILIFWLYSLFNKKGIKKVEGIPEELKEEIIQDLKALKKKSLSPREEVIETYNIFHNALQSLVFHYETPPSCIVYEGIKVAEPELKEPTFTVTETFALTFYGNREVTTTALKAFRRDTKKIFSFFGITF